MKITGNENSEKISDALVSQADIDSISESHPLMEKIFFDSLEASTVVKEVDFNEGKFEVQIDFNKLSTPPTISVSIDSVELAKDLFVNSETSANNREGVLQFIKAGVLSAITNSFSMDTFGDHLQILDEKLKSKTMEIQQADIEAGSLTKTEDVPQLVTSLNFETGDDAFTVSKVPPLEEKLLARGYDMTSIDEDDVMPENYKPLEDGTTANIAIKEDEGSFESIGRIKH